MGRFAYPALGQGVEEVDGDARRRGRRDRDRNQRNRSGQVADWVLIRLGATTLRVSVRASSSSSLQARASRP